MPSNVVHRSDEVSVQMVFVCDCTGYVDWSATGISDSRVRGKRRMAMGSDRRELHWRALPTREANFTLRVADAILSANNENRVYGLMLDG